MKSKLDRKELKLKSFEDLIKILPKYTHDGGSFGSFGLIIHYDYIEEQWNIGYYSNKTKAYNIKITKQKGKNLKLLVIDFILKNPDI